MESKSTGKSKVEKLIHSLDYAHNILPYFGYLHEVALFMLKLSSKSNQLFKSNIEIMRRLTFSSDNQIKTLNISSEFTQKIIDFIINNKLYLYFMLKICLQKNEDIIKFKSLFFSQLSYVDNYTFKSISIRLTQDYSSADNTSIKILDYIIN